MTMERLIRKTIFDWLSWLRNRRSKRVIPGYAATFILEAEGKRKHANTSHIREQRKKILLEALARKVRT